MTRKELRELAEKATSGPWEHHNWDVMERPHVVAHSLWNGKDHCNGHFDVPCTVNNTAYIAAANPATILKLLDALDVYEDALGTIEEFADCHDNPWACTEASKALTKGQEILGGKR